MMLARRGQSIIEYTIIIGIITVVLYYMGTSIKRGAQSLIKVTADQVGNQENADQDFNSIQGYMVAEGDEAHENNHREVTEIGYIPVSGIPAYLVNTSYNESSYTMTNTISNGGFTETQSSQ